MLNNFWGKINTWKKSNDTSYITIWLEFCLQVGVECSENVAFSSLLLSRRSSRCFWLYSVLHTNTWWHTRAQNPHECFFIHELRWVEIVFSLKSCPRTNNYLRTPGFSVCPCLLLTLVYIRSPREGTKWWGVDVFGSTAAFAALLAGYLITSSGQMRANES